MKRQRLDKTVSKYARFGDIQFPRENPLADYDSTWTKHFTDRTLIKDTQCWESTVLFSAREGWINSKSLLCKNLKCTHKNRTSYCSQRSDTKK